MSERTSLFGVPIEGGTAAEVLRAAEASPKPFWIVTANPEILLAAQESPEYAATLQKASWRTVDGFGLRFVMRLHGFDFARVTGVDLAEAFLDDAAKRGKRVAFFGSDAKTLDEGIAKWQMRYPNLALFG